MDKDTAVMAAKVESAVIGALHRLGQVSVAKEIGVQESTLSEMKGKQIPLVSRVIAACGLKVVAADRICVKREEWALVTRIAARALGNEATAMQLLWEDPE